MIRSIKFFITILLAVIAINAKSQSTATTSSPYSRYGLGDLSSPLPPQNLAMGGIGTATNTINGYSNINSLNPASYGYLRLTTIDVGIYTSTSFLSQTGQSTVTNANFRLSHIAFGIPVTHNSALSFGLQPYSQVGYNYKQNLPRGFGTSSPADTNSTNYIYQGSGGLSKAYFGYGITILKHLSLGFNASYIFGDIKQSQSTEIPGLFGTLNSNVEQDNAMKGFTYDYGAQYAIDITPIKHLTFGYSASSASQLNSQSTYIVSQYTFDPNGVASVAADSLIVQKATPAKVQLPQINHFGVSYQEDGKFLVGADFTLGKWSNLSIGGVNQGLLDSKTLNVGGQITPDINALNSYWSTVDYRLGAMYDQSFLNVPNPTGSGSTNIKSYALTFGLGMPLRPNTITSSFYKINFAVELGQRGTLANGLVKENYVNIHLGFMLNDKWFQRYKLQ